MIASDPKVVPAATVRDLLALPEEEQKRFELIDGALEDRGATSSVHGRAQHKLSVYTGPFDRRPGGRWPGGWWVGTEIDVYFDAANTLKPDVAGWRRERVPEYPREVPVMVRPDWVCEILSTNRRNDLVKKKRVYHRHQVPHYWIVDPEQETLSVLRWTPDGYIEVLVAERGEVVRAEPFEAIPLTVGVIFGDDEDESDR
jgi:Uma2 family endonuclease